MKDNRLKEQVLKDIREALMDKNPMDSSKESIPAGAPVDDLSVLFAQNFTQRGGTMYYCYNEEDIQTRVKEIQKRHGDVVIGCASENLTSFLGHLNIENRCTCEPGMHYPLGATLCEALIAWQGGIVISSNQGLGMTMATLPEALIVLTFTSQVVTDWEQANERLKSMYNEYPENLIITNPGSYAYRKGLHKLYLILIEDED